MNQECVLDSTCPCGGTFHYVGPAIGAGYRYRDWLKDHREHQASLPSRTATTSESNAGHALLTET